MEEVFKAKGRYFGASGREYSKDQVYEINESYWHCHPIGAPVFEVGEMTDEDTRMHGGYPQGESEPASREEKD